MISYWPSVDMFDSYNSLIVLKMHIFSKRTQAQYNELVIEGDEGV